VSSPTRRPLLPLRAESKVESENIGLHDFEAEILGTETSIGTDYAIFDGDGDKAFRFSIYRPEFEQ
jgi:hypothetical protein